MKVHGAFGYIDQQRNLIAWPSQNIELKGTSGRQPSTTRSLMAWAFLWPNLTSRLRGVREASHRRSRQHMRHLECHLPPRSVHLPMWALSHRGFSCGVWRSRPWCVLTSRFRRTGSSSLNSQFPRTTPRLEDGTGPTRAFVRAGTTLDD